MKVGCCHDWVVGWSWKDFEEYVRESLNFLKNQGQFHLYWLQVTPNKKVLTINSIKCSKVHLIVFSPKMLRIRPLKYHGYLASDYLWFNILLAFYMHNFHSSQTYNVHHTERMCMVIWCGAECSSIAFYEVLIFPLTFYWYFAQICACE